MPTIAGMVLEGQDPETRIDEVISSASWISEQDMELIQQGKQTVLSRIANESWVSPYVWRIDWENTPAQEARQWVMVNMQQSGGVVEYKPSGADETIDLH